MKKSANTAFEVVGLIFGFLVTVAGFGVVLSGVVALFCALYIIVTGAHSEWAPWFLALVGALYCLFGYLLLALGFAFFKDKSKQ